MYLELILKGEGMNHGVTLAPDNDMLDYGHVMMGDKYTNTLKLTNPSKLALSYQFVLASDDEAPGKFHELLKVSRKKIITFTTSFP